MTDYDVIVLGGARSSDALNLAAITSAPVFASLHVVDDGDRRQQDDSPGARLLRLALTAPPMLVRRETA